MSTNIYMKVPNVKGAVTTKGYEGWIPLSSVHFGVDRALNTEVGKVQNREGRTPEISEVELTKHLGPASNPLFQSACTGKAIPTIEIHVCTTDKGLTPYAKYKLTDAIITKHHHTIMNEALPMETLRLNYTKMEMTFIDRDNKGAQKSPNSVGYDLEAAEMS